jgi:hypothetical protein
VQTLGQQATQQLAVGAVLCTTDLADAVQVLGSGVDHPSEEQKDTYDNVSHKARFISSQLGSGYLPNTVGFNTDPEYKTQAAFIFF